MIFVVSSHVTLHTAMFALLYTLDITDTDITGSCCDMSLPQPNVVPLQPALERASRGKKSCSAIIVTMTVDGGRVFLGLELIHVLVIPLHPALRSLQIHSPGIENENIN